MPILSLRGTISALSAASVAVIAIITLSITLTTSLSALSDIGVTHSGALLANGVVELENFFLKPVRANDALVNASMRRKWPWPSDDPAVLTEWINMAWNAFVDCGPACAVGFYFADSTHIVIDASGWPPGYYAGYVRCGAPFSKGGLAYQVTQPITKTPIAAHWENHSLASPTDPVWDLVKSGIPDGLLMTTPFWNTSALFITGNGYARNAAGVFIVAWGAGTKIKSYIPFGAPLYTAGSPRGPANVYAVAMFSIIPSGISDLLRRAGGTPSSVSVAYDNEGYLLGSSVDRSLPFEETTQPNPAPTTIPDGCVSSASSTGIATSTTAVYVLCRKHISRYGIAALRAISGDASFAFNSGRAVRIVTVSSDTMYVAVGQVPLSYKGMSVFVAMVLPEADVIGNVMEGRNVAIGVTMGVFVLVAAASFVAISLLLSPLRTVSDRMLQAAALDDTDADRTLSVIAEVEDLQQAYYAMNDELMRIKSFVPQTVLRPRATLNDGDDEEEQSDTHDAPSTRYEVGSNRSRASQRSRRSRASDSSKRVPAVEPSGLNITCGLAQQRASIVVTNLNGFEEACAGMHRDAIVTAIGQTLDAVQDVAAANKGVLQSFHGDHFVLTFNTVMPCVAHARRAATAALRLANTATGIGMKLGLRAGVSTGRCLVGNVGSASAKAFSVIGPAFVHASLLERMTRLYGSGCRVLATRRTCEDVGTHISYRLVDAVRLPQSRGVTLVGALLQEMRAAPEHHHGDAGHHDGEWLYVVDNSTTVDKAINEAMVLFVKGDVVRAKEFAAGLTADEVCASDVRSSVLELIGSSAAADPSANDDEAPISPSRAMAVYFRAVYTEPDRGNAHGSPVAV